MISMGRILRSSWMWVALAAVLGLGLVFLALYVLPETLVDDSLRGKNKATAEHNARTSLLEALGGLAVLLGLVFTARTVWVTREGQITERFTSANEQLGDDTKRRAGRRGTRVGSDR